MGRVKLLSLSPGALPGNPPHLLSLAPRAVAPLTDLTNRSPISAASPQSAVELDWLGLACRLLRPRALWLAAAAASAGRVRRRGGAACARGRAGCRAAGPRPVPLPKPESRQPGARAPAQYNEAASGPGVSSLGARRGRWRERPVEKARAGRGSTPRASEYRPGPAALGVAGLGPPPRCHGPGIDGDAHPRRSWAIPSFGAPLDGSGSTPAGGAAGPVPSACGPRRRAGRHCHAQTRGKRLAIL